MWEAPHSTPQVFPSQIGIGIGFGIRFGFGFGFGFGSILASIVHAGLTSTTLDLLSFIDSPRPHP